MRELLVIGSSFLLGTIIVVQAYVNINLGGALGHPLRAACISFCVGACSLLLIHIIESAKGNNKISVSPELLSVQPADMTAVTLDPDPDPDPDPPSMSGEVVTGATTTTTAATAGVVLSVLCSRGSGMIIPYYYYCGGLLGAFYVSNAAISVPYIGYSVFYVCFVCGQLSCALTFDRFGILESPVLEIHPGRYIGCLCAAAGSVALLLASRGGDTPLGYTVLMVLGSFLSGVFLVTQSAVNSILRKKSKLSVVHTALISFSAGAASLLVISSLTYISPTTFSATPLDITALRWWHFFGGIIGLVYVGSAVVFPHIIGYAAFVVALIAGQLVASLLSDRFGLFGPEKASDYDPVGILGVCLGVLGATLVSVYK